MPSEKQLRWSQLRVGITVIVACVVLAILIFLMSGTGGLFSRKMTYYAYADNASGLRSGAPVRIQSVDAGNVSSIRVVSHGKTPVQIAMKINQKFSWFVHTDSTVELSTAGVLGETFVDIDSTNSKGPVAPNYAELRLRDVPDVQDVVRSSQTTLQNVNTLIQRADRIFTAVETQQGSAGQLIYDKALYRNLNQSVSEVQVLLNDVNQGKGSLGMLLKDDSLYQKANGAVDKLDQIANDVNSGHGTLGKFVKDPSLYDNANQTISRANQLMDSINRGQGTLGKLAKDPEFAKKLDSIATDLAIITHGLQAGEGSAGKLLKDPSLYNNTDQVMMESRALIQAVRQDPKRYLSIKLHIF